MHSLFSPLLDASSIQKRAQGAAVNNTSLLHRTAAGPVRPFELAHTEKRLSFAEGYRRKKLGFGEGRLSSSIEDRTGGRGRYELQQ